MTLQDVELNLNFVNRHPPAVPLALEPGFAPPQLPEHGPAPLQVPRTRWHGFLRPLNVLLCVVHGIAAGAVFGLTDTDVTEKLYRGTIKTTVVDKTASVDIVPGPHVEFFKLDFA